MKTKVYNRCHGMLATHALFYPVAFMVWTFFAMYGIEVDTATSVQIVFYALPQGFIAACGLLGLFNLYDYFTS